MVLLWCTSRKSAKSCVARKSNVLITPRLQDHTYGCTPASSDTAVTEPSQYKLVFKNNVEFTLLSAPRRWRTHWSDCRVCRKDCRHDVANRCLLVCICVPIESRVDYENCLDNNTELASILPQAWVAWRTLQEVSQERSCRLEKDTLILGGDDFSICSSSCTFLRCELIPVG